MTNETIASQLAHRTIRAYKDQPLTEEEVTTLMEVARHTATSSFLQSCTILHITDPKVREAIGAASGQPYVGGTKGDLFIFVADLYGLRVKMCVWLGVSRGLDLAFLNAD